MGLVKLNPVYWVRPRLDHYIFSLCPFSNFIQIVLHFILPYFCSILYSYGYQIEEDSVNLQFILFFFCVARDLSGQIEVTFINNIMHFFSYSLRYYTLKDPLKRQGSVFDDQGNNKTCSLRNFLSSKYFLTTVNTRRHFNK